MNLRNKLGSLRHISLKRLFLMPLILLLLGVNRFIILWVPFKVIASRLGKPMIYADSTFDPKKYNQSKTIGEMIDILSRHTPWESKCFVQALTAKELMNLFGIPSTVFFGLARNDEHALLAHAWVTYGDYTVTGKEGKELFKAVAYYG